jgi:hypothetical protein
MLSTELEYRCTEVECFLECWYAIERFGILSTVLEYLCTEMDCFLEG